MNLKEEIENKIEHCNRSISLLQKELDTSFERSELSLLNVFLDKQSIFYDRHLEYTKLLVELKKIEPTEISLKPTKTLSVSNIPLDKW